MQIAIFHFTRPKLAHLIEDIFLVAARNFEIPAFSLFQSIGHFLILKCHFLIVFHEVSLFESPHALTDPFLRIPSLGTIEVDLVFTIRQMQFVGVSAANINIGHHHIGVLHNEHVVCTIIRRRDLDSAFFLIVKFIIVFIYEVPVSGRAARNSLAEAEFSSTVLSISSDMPPEWRRGEEQLIMKITDSAANLKQTLR